MLLVVRPGAPFVASLLLVVRPGAPSSGPAVLVSALVLGLSGEFNPVLVLNEPFPHPWDRGRHGAGLQGSRVAVEKLK